jgi:hypothetical protein
MAASFSLAFSAILVLYVTVPRSYRAEAVVHIGVSYFQNPLIGDLISQTHDPGELRAEREKILKSALGVEFAERLGEKYQLFKTKRNDTLHDVEIELFLKSLDIAPVTATQFSIKYKNRNPETVNAIIHEAIDAIRTTMYERRVRMLEEFFAVLQDEIANTKGGAPLPGSGPMTPGGEKRVAAEKAQIQAQINVLDKRLGDLLRAYSENHPSVQAIKNEIAEMKDAERGGGLSAHLTKKRRVFRSGGSGMETMNIREDLRKQEHLLSISLEMEKKDPTMSTYVTLVKEPLYPKTPAFPKLKLFLLTALIMGIMASVVSVAMAEFWARAQMAPKQLAKEMGLELFGNVRLPG